MKIYVCHSTGFDYQNLLYKPIKVSPIYREHEFIFPHETPDSFINTKKIIQDCDLILAETSYPSTGTGIELGWADMFQKRVIAFYKEGGAASSALESITENIISYGDNNLIEKISNVLHEFSVNSVVNK